MHDDIELVLDRVRRTLDERIRPGVHTFVARLDVAAWTPPRGTHPPFAEAQAADYRPVSVGARWGSPWSTTWFRCGVPGGRSPGVRYAALFDLGFVGTRPGFQAEAMVYDAGGRIVKGLAPMTPSVPVGDEIAEPHVLYVEAAANPRILTAAPADRRDRWSFVPTDLGDELTAGEDPQYVLRRADLVAVHEGQQALAWDVEVLVQLALDLESTASRRHTIVRALEDLVDAYDAAGDGSDAEQLREHLADVLRVGSGPAAHAVSAVGHAHIDSAWLWPLRETVRKVARTFANVLDLQLSRPELVFAHSQAQHYAWIKAAYPALYERVRAAVTAGRWAPVGGMWVEADANLPGGEALARQLVQGKRFFLDEFGIETQEVWLPDSFGFSAALPQVASLAGNRWFLSQKLSWNESNRFPHHTFWWEGIDGTRIFTHFPPVDTYNAELTPRELRHAAANFSEKGRARHSLVPFGHGDGGGGPTRVMMERGLRLADLEGSPTVRFEAPSEFFTRAEAEYPEAPVWSGELYLEAHRGTFTTQARIKAGNRRAEHLLSEAELWSTLASRVGGVQYPAEALDGLWRTVLLHQFHDILPGTSIAQVNREAVRTYAEVEAALEALIGGALTVLSDGEAVFANAAPFNRREVIELHEAAAGIEDAPADRVGQRTADGRRAVLVEIPANSIITSSDAQVDDLSMGAVHATSDGLRNDRLHVTLDRHGNVTAIRDLLAERDLLPAGERANVLLLHPDRPSRWDAWDLDAHHDRTTIELCDAIDVQVETDGPLLGRVRVTRERGPSTFVQVLTLRAGSRILELETEVTWEHEEHVLKLAFPLAVHATHCRSEIQFGFLDRPIHRNTSWDAARFENFHHRWLRVSEAGYGIALTNDSVYGHDVSHVAQDGLRRGTMIRLSLLRAPRFPDPGADHGRHRFRVGFIAGASTDDAWRAGVAMNQPIRHHRRSAAAARPLPHDVIRLTECRLAMSAVKLADDGTGDLIVRVYEHLGGQANDRLATTVPFARAMRCDLLERPLEELPAADGAVPLQLRAFEIVTVRLESVGSSA